MKFALKLEELGMLLLSIWLFSFLPFAWWAYLALILVPDLSMIGYAFNNKIGAITYNIVHHKGIAIGLYILGQYIHNDWLQLAGLILFGHSSMDRMLGYGLKYYSGFKKTHLGEL